MLRVLGMRRCRCKASSGLRIVESIKHQRRSRPIKCRLHQRGGRRNAAARARDYNRRLALPYEFGFDGHEKVAPLLAIELARPCFMGLPVPQDRPQKAKRKLLAARGIGAVEQADTGKIGAFRESLADESSDLA